MATVYRKSSKGLVEIDTRAHRLTPRLRSALILVDGRKTTDDLAQLILAEPETTLAWLLSEGFIEAAGATAAQPQSLASSPVAAATAAPTVAATPARSKSTLEATRRDAARQLIDQAGPSAESLAIKLESAKSMAELQPLLVQSAQLLRNVRGSASSAAYIARFIDQADT